MLSGRRHHLERALPGSCDGTAGERTSAGRHEEDGMSQALHEKAGTSSRAGGEVGGARRPRRGLAAAVVGLGLLLGAAAGWTAFTAFSPAPDARSNTVKTARWQGAAEWFAEQSEARRWETERRRWEAQADHFDPGWRDR
jgi:hypothetical protein